MHKFKQSVLNIETWNENKGGIYSLYLDQLPSIQRNFYVEDLKLFKTICDKNIIRNLMNHTLNKIKFIQTLTNKIEVEIIARIYSDILKTSFYLIRKKTLYFTFETDSRIKIWVSRKQLNDYLNLNLINMIYFNMLNYLLNLYDTDN